MALLDATLTAPVVYPAMLLFADFEDLPLRYAFAPFNLDVPIGLTDADADCAGFTFEAVDSQVLSVGSVAHEDGGTQTLTISLRATPSDTDLLAAIESPALYVGRIVRIWLVLHDGAGTVTQISPSLGYTGYMGVPTQTVDPANGVMEVTLEVDNWLAILGGAPSRTYLTQSVYDAGDTSANVSIGNGNSAPGLGVSREPFDYSQVYQQR
jgi:hypothetical protein